MCEKIKFKNESEMEMFLAELLNKLNQKDEFNIFLHQINEGGFKSFGIVNGISLKIDSILKYGFYLSKYSSICGTAKLMGSSKEVSVDDVLDYRYYQNYSDTAICIIAIPKFVEFNGKKLEFSSFENKSNHDIDDNLRDAYFRLAKDFPDAHHRKCSLFDAMKGYKELPKCYLLGILNMNYQKDEFEFVNPNSHLIFKSDEEVQGYKKFLAEKTASLFEKYQTNDAVEVIVKAYKEEEAIRSAESDFDF